MTAVLALIIALMVGINLILYILIDSRIFLFNGCVGTHSNSMYFDLTLHTQIYILFSAEGKWERNILNANRLTQAVLSYLKNTGLG